MDRFLVDDAVLLGSLLFLLYLCIVRIVCLVTVFVEYAALQMSDEQFISTFWFLVEKMSPRQSHLLNYT